MVDVEEDSLDGELPTFNTSVVFFNPEGSTVLDLEAPLTTLGGSTATD